ncbi:MAG TPA: molybdopterin converting factor subunit 1 [Kofleriaceae bacterium]|jgi:molybdopterin synthase catalytic subunit|nr:molybdopterin converting factor subunit 1 [Kofleriaceae bacterium]
MRIRVLYFAVFREKLRADGETIELADGSSLAALVSALEARHDAVRALRGRYRIAVNQSMVVGDEPLADDDEVALIPPVAGGTRHVLLSDTPLSLDRCVDFVRGPDAGGIVTFTGMVRRESHGERIERLEYEAYPGMAEKVMHELCDAIEREVPGVRLAVEHRVGVLAVGEIAVVIAAAAPHRAEAFTACRALIDRLKEHVPIWKKEIGESGAEWVGLGP